MKTGIALVLLIILIVIGCDIYRPQKSFVLAVPEKDTFYKNTAAIVIPFLERNGYQIETVQAPSAAEANRLVATGAADLTFANNVSASLDDQLGQDASNLRSLVPLAKRLCLAFSRERIPEGTRTRLMFEKKNVAVELLGGEGHMIMQTILDKAQIRNTRFVEYGKDSADLRIFWGTVYGNRSVEMLEKGWYPISFSDNWVSFLTLEDPALEPFHSPALPGNENAVPVNTIATDAVLVVNKILGEKAAYELAQTFIQQKMELVRNDAMFRSISESFNKESLLYPLHEGTASYLRRDQPTFFERYADPIALIMSLIAVSYGAVQAFQTRMSRIKKERIDEYFIQFLSIRSGKETSKDEKLTKLNSLFDHAMEQMTHEKLDKGDFHIFSRLVQQELTILLTKT